METQQQIDNPLQEFEELIKRGYSALEKLKHFLSCGEGVQSDFCASPNQIGVENV